MLWEKETYLLMALDKDENDSLVSSAGRQVAYNTFILHVILQSDCHWMRSNFGVRVNYAAAEIYPYIKYKKEFQNMVVDFHYKGNLRDASNMEFNTLFILGSNFFFQKSFRGLVIPNKHNALKTNA